MSQPLVSVIVPAHNDAAFIGAAIESVLAQDYRPVEIIVIDDGSSDATVQTAAAYGDPVRVIEQANSGAAVARSRGMEAARGALIAFLDADDYWLEGKLSAQVAHLERHPEVGAVYSRWAQWYWPQTPDPHTVVSPDVSGRPPGIDAAESGWIYSRLLLDCTVHTSTAILRREIVERVGAFDARLRKGQDYDYWLRCSRITQFHKLDRPLSLYRIRSDSITRRVSPTNYGALVIEGAVAKWGRTGPDGSRTNVFSLARRRAQLWRDFAHSQLSSGDAGLAVSAAARSLLRWPLDLFALRLLARACGRALVGMK